MSIDLSSPVISPKSKEVAKAISSELLIHFASLAIENGLAPINDMTIDASLIEPNGKTLWLSEMLTAPLAITNVLSNCTTQEALFSLFTHPVKLQGTFYYLAPIYCENRALIAIVAFASQTVDSTILLALANAVGREISEKIKRHLCLQELVLKTSTYRAPRAEYSGSRKSGNYRSGKALWWKGPRDASSLEYGENNALAKTKAIRH